MLSSNFAKRKRASKDDVGRMRLLPDRTGAGGWPIDSICGGGIKESSVVKVGVYIPSVSCSIIAFWGKGTAMVSS